MKLIKMKCPGCGADLEADSEKSQAFCTYCGQKIMIDNETQDLRLADAEKTGYQFEKGRMKARREMRAGETKTEAVQEKPKKKHTLLNIFLWIIFFPIMLTIFIWHSDMTEKLSRKTKIILTAALWAVVLIFYGANKIQDSKPKKNTIRANEIYYADWLDDNFESGKNDAIITEDPDTGEVTVSLDLVCLKSPAEEIKEMFAANGRDMEQYTMYAAQLQLQNILLTAGDVDAETMRNSRTVNEILNMQSGEEKTLQIVFKPSQYELKELLEATQMYIRLNLIYLIENDDISETVFIPWSVSTVDKHAETPVPEETAVAEETPAPEESSVPETDEYGMTPGFKDMMDSYEAFFDEYIAFMEKYETSDNQAAMMADYLKFMGKYAECMQALDEMDESEMNDADTKYYLEVTGRISQKLISAAQ